MSKYRRTVPSGDTLSFVLHGVEIKMAWEEHRAIFFLYFAILTFTGLLFGVEARYKN